MIGGQGVKHFSQLMAQLGEDKRSSGVPHTPDTLMWLTPSNASIALNEYNVS